MDPTQPVDMSELPPPPSEADFGELPAPPAETLPPPKLTKRQKKRLRAKKKKQQKREAERKERERVMREELEKEALREKLRARLQGKRDQRSGKTMREARSRMKRAGVDVDDQQKLRALLASMGMDEKSITSGMSQAQREQMTSKVAEMDPAKLAEALGAVRGLSGAQQD